MSLKLKDLLQEKNQLNESEVHMKKDGNTYYVDTNFVNYSKLIPNSKISHLGMGDFKLETKFGDVEFSRVSKKINGFVGRTHKVRGDKSTIEKIIKNLGDVSSVNMIKEEEMIIEADVKVDDISFKVVEDKGRLVLIPSSTSDLDKLRGKLNPVLEIEEELKRKTNIKFREDKSYRGNGYAFVPDYMAILK